MDDLDVQQTGFEFFSNFDSANLSRVEYVTRNESVITPASNTGRSPISDIPTIEFNIWTKPDCYRTEFENANRTWFHFGIRANSPGIVVRLNMVDLNRQAKMYSQGMAPVYKIVPGKPHWERIRDKPVYTMDENIFTLSFKYKTPENTNCIVYFAFTYPYSFVDLMSTLDNIDSRFVSNKLFSKDDIYYHREVLCFSLDRRRVDLITISSHHNISADRETRLKCLFPEEHVPRPFKFIGKKVIFVSARVHPGETPSSFVLNGFLNFLLNREDSIAIQLRKLYVFKLIPMLNPDGVARGHYRTDTRGVNLNRMYLNPSLIYHPSIYGARALIRYYHYGYEKEDVINENLGEFLNDNNDEDLLSVSDNCQGLNNDNKLSKKVSHMTLEENRNEEVTRNEPWCCKCKINIAKLEETVSEISNIIPTFNQSNPLSTGKLVCKNCCSSKSKSKRRNKAGADVNMTNKCEHGDNNSNESGLFMYLDMHGHASKKGIFMYGNHFEEFEKNIECMLLPKIMSLNNHNFHFTACNFTERNMYLRDRRDGMSREGSGRVAVLKLTGLIRSYTLECNYNTGRLVNILPCSIRESSPKVLHPLHIPPKYTPSIFEEVGKALGPSILDLTGHNPFTRLPHSQFHTLNGLRDWLRIHCSTKVAETRCATSRFKVRNPASLHAQGKSVRGIVVKTRSTSVRSTKRLIPKALHSTSVSIERKENIYENREAVHLQPSCSNVSRTKPRSYTSRSKMRKEVSPKLKVNVPNEKSKSTPNIRPMQNPSSKPRSKVDHLSKLQTIKEKQEKSISKDKDESESRFKLREICFIKSSEGKRMIAKYKGKGDDVRQGIEDNLIVAWDHTNSPQVFSHKTKGPGMLDIKPMVPDRGPHKVGVFRVHNFARSTKIKRNKRPLRRLATTVEASNKVDKLKKRKIGKGQSP